ncbi:hypothetical protein [Streptomyces sp. AP-93]|uniref:hypothetical protein n=1 Tax=Streptomyces sp. AP-93 TaxID=2929048 RepID=UPI001FB01472|nr:hypothetical protein [Streptomyces sp. AP-93]MCJ0874201.1 hypothetical protein [Streptomyces sp. AP-93]
MFDWSKRKANSWVHLPGTRGPLNVDENRTGGSGNGTYAASYWAGYANRSGYYSRDMAHQLSGAGVLALHAENKSMLRSFAASATPEHKYYPAWAFNFDTSTYLSIGYKSPTNFVREVPATFELVQKSEEAYRWSGDRAYLDDPALWNFSRRATDEFVTLHDGLKDNGAIEVAEGSTGSRLPSGMDWLRIDDLRVGDSAFALRHDGATKSTLTHTSGASPYTWEARFPGTHATLTVDGVPQPARTKVVDGVTYTYATPTVAPGRTITVQAG